ncbi:unnamed protein product, partial [marine sediment metagenome]
EDSVNITGWTCNDTYKLTIRAGEDQDYPTIHDNDGDAYVIRVSSDYIRITGLNIEERTSSGLDYCIHFNDVNNVTVDDCILDSAAPAGYNYCCNAKCNYLTIENCTLTGEYGIYQFYEAVQYTDIEISNCTFINLDYSSAKGSIYHDASSTYPTRKWYIHHNRFYNCAGDAAIYLEYLDDVEIYNNMIDIGGSWPREVYNIAGIYIYYIYNDAAQKSWIVNNTIYNVRSNLFGIYLDRMYYGQTYVINNIITLDDGVGSSATYGFYCLNIT